MRGILSYFYSIMLHVVLGAFLFFSIGAAKPVQKGTHKLAIEATVVNQADIEEEIQRLDKLDRQRQQAEIKRKEDAKKQQEKLDALRVQREEREAEAEKERIAFEKEKQELEQQRQEKKAELKKLAEDKQRQELAAKALEEKQRLAEEKRKAEEAKAAQAKRKREAEEQRLADAQRKREEAAKQRQREEEAAAQAAAEAEMLAALDVEQQVMNARQSGDVDRYALLIQSHIENNWVRPPNVQAGLNCALRVKQIPGGEVISVEFGDCNADPITRRSIYAAVQRASPLPPPPNSVVFDRNLRITFAPDDE